jgi:hypothetical protein
MILPEDDANRQLANGFVSHAFIAPRSVQVLPSAGGWARVRDEFREVHAAEMEQNQLRWMVLLVDFDEKASRLNEVKIAIPDSLADRVFIIGVWTVPEHLRKHGLPAKEEFAQSLANECYENRRELWKHDLLQHNAGELERMTLALRPILFPPM